MPSYSIPTDHGKYDFLITITWEDCIVTIQENEGRDGSGATIYSDTYQFASEIEAQAFYQAEVRRRDPIYAPPMEENTTAFHTGEPVYLEFCDERSHKFYEVCVAELTVTIRYGRIGTDGQTSSSTYDTPQKAQAAADKKINEKLKKGYVRSQTPRSSQGNHPAQGNQNLASIPYWLPEDFCVYTNGTGAVGTQPGTMPGVEARTLPTVNHYTGADGGYVAFYSRDPEKAVYSVGGGIYIIGQIRLKGRYIGRIFHPAGYEYQDISAAPEFKELCRKTFAVEGWAGGDTGGWFGAVSQGRKGQNQVENRFSETIENTSFSGKIPTTSIMSVTLPAGEEVFWETTRLRRPCVMQIVASSQGGSFSFNLMAGEDIAYHFNPRANEAQIVQNTRILNHWGTEERLPLPSDIALGREFELTIVLEASQLTLYLNSTFLCSYRHRIRPSQIDGLRLISVQGNLQVLSVKIS